MIKFFKSQDSYNWVSDNGQFVGFSNFQNCCESFGYCYVRHFYEDFGKMIDVGNHNDELNDLIESNEFECDNTFKFGDLKVIRKEDICGVESFVSIEILKDCRADNTVVGYLVLYNCHNGYYSHGFEYNLKPNNDHDSL